MTAMDRAAIDSNVAAATAYSLFRTHERRLKQSRQIYTFLFGAIFVALIIGASIVGEFNPLRLWEAAEGLGRYLTKTIPAAESEGFLETLNVWFWDRSTWLVNLFDSILIAIVATVGGATIAYFLCFFASFDLTPSRTLCFVTRRILEVLRSIPDLVFALIFVFAFGIGPFAGVLAVMVHTVGALGKLFSEVNENIDQKPLEGLRASGASWSETMRLGVTPQVLPNFASYAILRFEINVRAAGVIGYVGGGGIGQDLVVAIKQFEYADVSAIVLMLFVTVMIIDLISEKVRKRLIDGWVS